MTIGEKMVWAAAYEASFSRQVADGVPDHVAALAAVQYAGTAVQALRDININTAPLKSAHLAMLDAML